MKKICVIQDCSEVRRGKKEYCNQHFMRLWRYGDPLGGKFRKKTVTTGKRNYISPEDVCTIDGCETTIMPHGARGMCKSHYGKWYQHGDPHYEQELIDYSAICVVDTCESNIKNGFGYCQSHWYKLKVHGDVNYMRVLRTDHPLYKTWAGMRSRCSDKSNSSYRFYGGRGIKVCDRWNNLENGFENFIEDMGEKPDGCSIDRIDNDGDYEPSNCRWATHIQQQNNKNNTTFIECFGKKKSISDWGRELGMDPSVIRGRIKLGWPIEKALKRPVRAKST